MRASSKLGLGGHSYMQQLGNDPKPAFEEQCEIVSACLDNGIHLFDTTYYQERVALGVILERLGRREEARIMAWNFFKQLGKEDDLVPYTSYEPHHLDIMLEELQTDYIDTLVIHADDDADGQRRELELARDWMESGRIGSVALGMAKARHLDVLPEGHPVGGVLAPYNAFVREAADVFALANSQGMEKIALSPFIRGWKLDEIGEDPAKVSGILLRWVTSQDLVDHVIVSMRKSEWVRANLDAVARGPITEEEQIRLEGWLARVG
jgi:aryl-alcohol dehydrogenase-like predicted oxidoreductase